MNDGYAGQAQLTDGSELNGQALLIKRMMSQMHTATIVKIVAVHPNHTVDVLPTVNQIDGDGNATKHETVYGLPYMRLQGGVNAIIMDPVIGDLGIAVFASRDISAVKANKDQSNPGSRRRFSMADGMYMGGLLNGAPTQYVSFTDSGIEVVSPTKVTIRSPNVAIEGDTLTHNGVNIGSTHVHPDAQGGSTGGPR